MDQINNKSICPYAFKGAMITVNSTVRPCCRYSDWDEVKPTVSDTNTIEDIFYSEYYQSLRKRMLAGEMIPGCKKCYKEEQAGVLSMRNSSHILEADTNIELEYLEVESGRHCNLKCRSCNPEISTGWNEDIKKSDDLAVMYGYRDNLEELDSFKYNDALRTLTKEQCSKLKQIKATGGEPFLSKSFLTLIENLDKWDLAKNITLEVYTNVSFMPKPKFVKSLMKLKKIELCMSIDSIKERNDYLRAGSDWNTVVQVTDFWLDLASKNKEQFKLVVSNTISIFNILTIDQLIQFIADKEIEFDVYIEVHHVVLHYPRHQSIYNFSRQTKDKILGYLKEIPSKVNFPLYEYNKRNLRKLSSVLESSSPTTVSAKKDFFHTTNSIDKVRGESWKTVFPEVLKLLRG